MNINSAGLMIPYPGRTSCDRSLLKGHQLQSNPVKDSFDPSQSNQAEEVKYSSSDDSLDSLLEESACISLDKSCYAWNPSTFSCEVDMDYMIHNAFESNATKPIDPTDAIPTAQHSARNCPDPANTCNRNQPQRSDDSAIADDKKEKRPGHHMREEKYLKFMHRARNVKRDKPSKETFFEALEAMERDSIVLLSRCDDVRVGIQGIWAVEVLAPAAFAQRIWPPPPPAGGGGGGGGGGGAPTLFPCGFRSEAIKPKNTFMAQWDRKGFEHSYSLVDDLKISAKWYDGREVPAERDVRYRRLIALMTSLRLLVYDLDLRDRDLDLRDRDLHLRDRDPGCREAGGGGRLGRGVDNRH